MIHFNLSICERHWGCLEVLGYCVPEIVFVRVPGSFELTWEVNGSFLSSHLLREATAACRCPDIALSHQVVMPFPFDKGGKLCCEDIILMLPVCVNITVFRTTSLQ